MCPILLSRQVPATWAPEVQKETSLGERSYALMRPRRSGGPCSYKPGQPCPALTPRNMV